MNLFIDTNILLDFYRMSSGDLEEIRKIARLSANKKIRLLISDFVIDEFNRNREGVIAQSISQFKKSKIELHRPNIIRSHSESVELEKLQKRFKELIKISSDKAIAEAKDKSTKADVVIKELFESTEIQPVDAKIIDKAIRRGTLRRPPGKESSIGDSIHWEWLLSIVNYFEDLHLISGDGDFESAVNSGFLANYLDEEWASINNSKCILYLTLADFLKNHFADIKLADEIDKYILIDRLETSPNFATTHNTIAKLSKFDDYTQKEIQRLISAYITNNQINWILGDEDVKAFAHKIVTLAYENNLSDEAFPIEEMLNELELEENP
jgi:predicted nucleic acid-binding protein